MATMRKMLINGFEKEIRRRGWADSKKSPYTIHRGEYKSVRHFARCLAGCYDLEQPFPFMNETLTEMMEEAATQDRPLTQHDFDEFAHWEIECALYK